MFSKSAFWKEILFLMIIFQIEKSIFSSDKNLLS